MIRHLIDKAGSYPWIYDTNGDEDVAQNDDVDSQVMESDTSLLSIAKLSPDLLILMGTRM